MSEFCEKKGIKKEFSLARTPQQNGVAERRNMTLIEAARTMLTDSKLSTTFWAEAVNTACYVNVLEKQLKGFFVGYLMNSKAFRVYNIRTRKVEENLHIRFLEDKPIIAGDGTKWLFDIDVLTKLMNYMPVVASTNSNDLASIEESIGAGHSSKETGSSQDYILMPLWKDGSLFDSSSKNDSNDEPQPSSDAGKKDDEGIHKDHSLDHVIGDVQSGVQTRRMTKTTNKQGFISDVYEGKTHKDFHTCSFACFLSQEEPKKGYTQEEGIDYDEVFALVARIEAIRLFLAYASFKDFVVYQMDVKSAILYGKIEEEVYVCQPLGFEDPEFSNRVYKVEKALYGLHQAPRAWYETLSIYLLDNGFQRGQIDKTLFIKRVKSDILLVQVYVDDIIFGSTKKELCIEFEKLMHKKFQMSYMGIETNVNVGQAGQEKAFDHEYILLPLMLSNSPLSSSTQSIDDKDADEVPDKGDDDVSQRNGQEKEGGASNKEDDPCARFQS
ncbi:putative ribonuclease H-like domain-containing protein [Tanacetum coccineum]